MPLNYTIYAVKYQQIILCQLQQYIQTEGLQVQGQLDYREDSSKTVINMERFSEKETKCKGSVHILSSERLPLALGENRCKDPKQNNTSPGKPRVQGLEGLQEPESSSIPEELKPENKLRKAHRGSQNLK